MPSTRSIFESLPDLRFSIVCITRATDSESVVGEVSLALHLYRYHINPFTGTASYRCVRCARTVIDAGVKPHSNLILVAAFGIGAPTTVAK